MKNIGEKLKEMNCEPYCDEFCVARNIEKTYRNIARLNKTQKMLKIKVDAYQQTLDSPLLSNATADELAEEIRRRLIAVKK